MVEEFKPGKWAFKHKCSNNLAHHEGSFPSKAEALKALQNHVENCHDE